MTDPVQNGTTQFTFDLGGLTPGQKIKVVAQGVLLPIDLSQQLYDANSLFLFQPLLTEEFHELEIIF